ncbi:MAG: nucleotidyltransferase [Nitrosomonadales bacterium]|nr:nucleotidyltransferase [Nitrosomonadales bacterium]
MAEEEYARPATIADLKTVIQSLNKNKVDYFLIGGYALFAHGYYRATTDIDILVPPTREQGKRVIEALLALPERAGAQIDPAWFDEGETIRVADEFVVDLMFNASGETSETLARYAEIIDLDGIPVRTLSLEGLLLTKQTVRDKDAMDRMVLQKAIEAAK